MFNQLDSKYSCSAVQLIGICPGCVHVFAGSSECGKAIIAGFLGVPLVRLDDLSNDKRGQEGADSLMPFSLTAVQSVSHWPITRAGLYDKPVCYIATQPASQPASQACEQYII